MVRPIMTRMTPRTLPALVMLACAGALAFAFTAQHVFGLLPCILCYTQRVPFAVAGLLAALAFARPRLARPLMVLAGLAFLVNAGIAVYHVGVEQHWWASTCSGGSGIAAPSQDLASLMSKPVAVSCDQPAWQFHGITMAGLNIPFSGGLAAIVLLLALRRSQETGR